MLRYTVTLNKVLKRYINGYVIHEDSNNDYFLYK